MYNVGMATDRPSDRDPDTWELERKLIQEIGVGTLCTACGVTSTAWNVLHRPVMLVGLEGPDTPPETPDTYKTLATVCPNCGFVRLHLASVFMREKDGD